MNLRDAFEEGLVRGRWEKGLNIQLDRERIPVDKTLQAERDIVVVSKEIEQYQHVLGERYKETNYLVRRANDK